jgi:hypothetical protein
MVEVLFNVSWGTVCGGVDDIIPFVSNDGNP